MARIFKAILSVLAFFYGVIVGLMKFCYRYKLVRRYRLNCKVISVGNITWGGTGKTPLVEYIAKRLTGQGKKVAILSRGYGRRDTRYAIRDTQYESMGDEPYMLKMHLPNVPIVVGEDRVKNGRLAIEKYGADTIILDDGFQRWRLLRDLDIVVIDATNPFGNARLIPRGILREDPGSLRRADIFLLTKSNLTSRQNSKFLQQRLDNINPDAMIVESIHKPQLLFNHKGKTCSLNYLEGRNICIVSSIARPESFRRTILNLGAIILLELQYPDHHAYRQEDLERMVRSCKEKDLNTLLTTEKDYVRLKGLLEKIEIPLDILVLKIEIEILCNEEKFLQRLSTL